MSNFIKAGSAIIIVLMLLPGCGEKVKPGIKEVKRQRVSGVTLETIVLSQVDEYFETSGTIAAKTVSVVASRVMGVITSIKVKEGDRVAAGQILLTIDDRDIAQKVRAAAAGHNEAEKGLEAAEENKKLTDITYGRYKKLYDEKALSGQELDQIDTQRKVADIDLQRAESAVARAKAGLDEARVYRGFAGVTSPVRGVVTEKKAEIGSMAVPGAPLFAIEDNSGYKVEVNADESLAERLKPGMDAVIYVDTLKREIRGIITEVVPSVDSMSRSFVVKIAIKGEGLRNGFYGKVSIPIGKKEVLLVPKNSVIEKGQLTGVYTVDNDSVIAYRLVKTGKSYEDKIEILSGLNPGDKVIVGGVEKALDGGILK
jgi:RND family efflux transporter MFP subunit